MMVHLTSLGIWVHNISSTILTLGYPGVFVAMVFEGLGLPFPGDAFLTFYGYAISQNHMNGIAVLCISTLGYFAGVSIVYWLVRRFGKLLLDPLYRLHIVSETRMESTSQLMHQYGALILIPGKFLPGIRSLSTYAAAIGKMPYSLFAFYTLIGSILWCGMWIGLGFWFGENMHTLMRHVQTTLMWFTIALVLTALLVWFMRRVSNKAGNRK